VKKVICKIEEDYNKFLISFILIKEKGKSFNIVDRIPVSINKNSLLNNKEIKEIVYMINKSLTNHKFQNSNCIIGLNSFKTIRDEFVYPKISINELKKVVKLEISKRYGDQGKIYNKISKEEDKIKSNVIIITSDITTLIDELFNQIKLKVKKILFYPESLDNYINNHIDNSNYFFLYEGNDYYIMNVVINNSIKYSSTQSKSEKLITKLMSIYGFYSHELDNKIYVSLSTETGLEEIESLELKKYDILPNKQLEIESLVSRYVRNDYERL